MRQMLVLNLAVAALVALRAVPGDAQAARVHGVVHDSLVGAPMAGAWVQLVAVGRQATRARTVISDSLGRFAFEGLADGRYLIGFFHPVLDSLGIEAPLRQVAVRRGRSVQALLGTPSAERLRAAICASNANGPTGGTVLGVVRDAQSRTALSGATVAGEWMEMTLRRGGAMTRRRGRLDAVTAENGWYALCDVPARGTLFLHAARERDSTDVLELPMPASGFLRRDLFIGPSRLVVIDDSAAEDSTLSVRRARVGRARLSGTIVSANGGRPLTGVLLRIGDNPPVRTDDRGAFTLTEAPHGSRMLEVRAVGYAPLRLAVDVVNDAAPVTLMLTPSTMMLDTVRVVVARAADRRDSGFAERRRSGAGTYLDAQQIARRGAFATSDIFRQLRGLRIGYDYDTLETDANPNALSEMNQLSDRRVLMRGISGNWCEPALWFDGALIPELSVDALDAWAPTARLFAIEVYSEATVPPQYQRSRSGCGAILFWTR